MPNPIVSILKIPALRVGRAFPVEQSRIDLTKHLGEDGWQCPTAPESPLAILGEEPTVRTEKNCLE
jgi:hypothetical protein